MEFKNTYNMEIYRYWNEIVGKNVFKIWKLNEKVFKMRIPKWYQNIFSKCSKNSKKKKINRIMENNN